MNQLIVPTARPQQSYDQMAKIAYENSLNIQRLSDHNQFLSEKLKKTTALLERLTSEIDKREHMLWKVETFEKSLESVTKKVEDIAEIVETQAARSEGRAEVKNKITHFFEAHWWKLISAILGAFAIFDFWPKK